MLTHDFFTCHTNMPAQMPIQTLVCPPSTEYIEQFDALD